MKARIENGTIVEVVPEEDVQHFSPLAVFVDWPEYLSSDIMPYITHNGETFAYDVEAMKTYMKEKIAARRWGRETGGINFTELAFTVPTTAEAQAKILSIFNTYRDGDIAADSLVAFMVGDTGIELNQAQIAAVKRCVAQHVQNSFAKQKELYDWVDTMVDGNDSLEALLTDFNAELAEWPGNTFSLATTMAEIAA